MSEESIFTKKIEEKPQKQSEKQPSKSKKIIGIFTGIFIMLFLLSVAIIFSLIISGGDHPLLKILSIQPAEIQTALLKITNIVFFLFSAIIFCVVAFGVFISILAKKEQIEKKKMGTTVSIISFALLFVVIFVWIFLYNFISKFKFKLQIKEEIVILNENIKNLRSPIAMNFSIKNLVILAERKGKSIANIYWDFDGDGSYDYNGLDLELSHEFKTPGYKRADVTLQFKNGTSQKFEKIFKINSGGFQAKPSVGFAPLKVSFDASFINDGIFKAAEYRWYFEGKDEADIISLSSKTEYIFEKIGNYNIQLVVLDKKGTIKKYNKKIKVKIGRIDNNLNIKIGVFPGKKGVAPFKVKFFANSSKENQKIISYKWIFDEFEKALKGKEIIKTFEKPGKYKVKLNIEYENGIKKEFFEEIEVVQELKKNPIKIKTSPQELNGFIPYKIDFEAVKLDKNLKIINYYWDFDGDGKFTLFGNKATNTFKKKGSFTSILKVEDEEGNFYETSVLISVKEKKEANISFDKDSGQAPLEVSFSTSKSAIGKGDKITNISWDFGDGILKDFSGANQKHIFEIPGIYTVRIKIFTKNGKEFSAEKKIFVREKILKSCFVSSKTKGKAPTEIKFESSCSSGNIENWEWDFGNGKYSYERNPINKYLEAGNFQVILKIKDDKNNFSTFKKEIILE